MAHELDFSTGKAAVAFRGETPWHGLGESILPQDSIDDIRIKAGLNYDVIKTPVQFTGMPCQHGANNGIKTSKDKCVLYRSDTLDDLSVVSTRYQVVQPRQIVDFYRDLSEKYGFEVEVVGALKGGRKVWALANTKNAFQLRGSDNVKCYLLLATSYDGSMATQARFTSVRVVCNNTLSLADSMGRAEVVVPHSTAFDADKVKLDLNIGSSWDEFALASEGMTRRIVDKNETMRFLLDVYYGLGDTEQIKAFQDDEKNTKSAEKFMARMTTALFNSPGANMESAKGLLWGLVNAVTYDIDHQMPSRSQDTRLNKAWFGNGAAIKQRAWAKAKQMMV